MANTSGPFGFSQYRGTGSSPTYEQVTMLIAYNNATPIYYGDAVVPVTGSATGYIKQATASTVALAGIFVGCKYLSISQKQVIWSRYWPGNDVAQGNDVTAYVINDPVAQFKVQAGGTAVGFSKIGQYIQLNVGTGNASNGLSGMYVENPATTVTLPFRVIDVVLDPPGANGTDQTTGFNYVIVGFNNLLGRSNGAGPTGIS